MTFSLNLSEQQTAAVTASSHTLVVACPGSGKTRVLVEKAAYIIERDPRSRILIVTFTRQAAKEVRQRLHGRLPLARDRFDAQTFHALALRQLWQSKGFEQLLDPGQQAGLLRRCWKHYCPESPWPDFASAVEARASGQSLAHIDDDIQQAIEHYLYLLERHSALDFNEAVMTVVRNLQSGTLPCLPCTHLFVDEFQDVDRVQLAWVLAHTNAGATLTAVGDDDQSIYGWRGSLGHAAVTVTQSRLSATILPLETNYRSRIEILGLSSRVISNNQERVIKTLTSHRGPGGVVKCIPYTNNYDELDGITARVSPDPSNWAIITRSNFQLDHIEAHLAQLKVPYHRPGKSSFWQSEGPALLLSLLSSLPKPGSLAVGSALSYAGASETDIRALVTTAGSITRSPPPGLSQNTVRNARSLARALGKASRQPADLAIQSMAHWLESHRPSANTIIEPILVAARVLRAYAGSLDERITKAKRPKSETTGTGVTLITMHSAKGKEFPKVWLPGLLDGTVPNKRSENLEEERRLLYVAITRAEDQLILSFPWEVHTVSIDDVKRITKRVPSRFLTVDLGIDLQRNHKSDNHRRAS